MARYVEAARIVDELTSKDPGRSGCTEQQRDDLVRSYRAVLDRPDWCAEIRAEFDPDAVFATWFAGVAGRLQLRAWDGPGITPDGSA